MLVNTAYDRGGSKECMYLRPYVSEQKKKKNNLMYEPANPMFYDRKWTHSRRGIITHACWHYEWIFGEHNNAILELNMFLADRSQIMAKNESSVFVGQNMDFMEIHMPGPG